MKINPKWAILALVVIALTGVLNSFLFSIYLIAILWKPLLFVGGGGYLIYWFFFQEVKPKSNSLR